MPTINDKHKHEIKYVALYLRKSRGDEETALDKHKIILHDLAKQYNWKYVSYEEIGTSDSIILRPKMQQLLKEVEDGIYDAVCCVDYDRLSRGDLGDQDKVKKAFQKSGTYIITPQKIYDLNDELDDTYTDFQGLLARQEYKMIVKRLQRGKKIGARQGNWVNGNPPFPYEYQRYKEKYNEKGLVINDEKKIIYDYMVQQVLSGKNCAEIAWDLNRQSIPSPKGKLWHKSRVYMILTDETHLGKIISNKTIGNAAKNRKENAQPLTRLPKSEWIVVENCHEPTISEEDFHKIKDMLERRRLYPVASRAGKHSLSGLIKCALCGSTMQIQLKVNGKNQIKKCWHANEFGNMCPNRGGLIAPIEDDIWMKIQEQRDRMDILMKSGLKDTNNFNTINIQLEEQYKLLEKYRNALDKCTDAYDLGDYTRDEFIERKTKWTNEIKQVEDKISELDSHLKDRTVISLEEKITTFNYILEQRENYEKQFTSKEKNELLKMIVDDIPWKRIGREVGVWKVNFIKGVNNIDETTDNIIEGIANLVCEANT